MKTFATIVMGLAVVALVGCGSSGGSTRGGSNSADRGNGNQKAEGNQPDAAPNPTTPTALGALANCNASELHFCFEAPSGTQTPAGRMENFCGQIGGTLAQGSCPTALHVGTCVHHNGVKVRYYDPMTAVQVKQGCTDESGHFSATY